MGIFQLAEDLVTQEQLDSNSTATSGITHAACLAHPDAAFPTTFDVMGWGLTERGQTSSHLMTVEMPLLGAAGGGNDSFLDVNPWFNDSEHSGRPTNLQQTAIPYLFSLLGQAPLLPALLEECCGRCAGEIFIP